MKAYKCDRCGKFYEDYISRKSKEIYNITRNPNITGCCLDLCKDCSDELQEWVDAFTKVHGRKRLNIMTRKDAIEELTTHLMHWKRLLREKICSQEDGERTINALEIAIKALEQEPCKDAVSRENVMKCFKKWQPYMSIGVWNYERELSKIPSVTLKPKTGRWIECEYNGMGFIKCSECLSGFLSANLLRNSYCPNCGAKMVKSEDK